MAVSESESVTKTYERLSQEIEQVERLSRELTNTRLAEKRISAARRRRDEYVLTVRRRVRRLLAQRPIRLVLLMAFDLRIKSDGVHVYYGGWGKYGRVAHGHIVLAPDLSAVVYWRTPQPHAIVKVTPKQPLYL